MILSRFNPALLLAFASLSVGVEESPSEPAFDPASEGLLSAEDTPPKTISTNPPHEDGRCRCVCPTVRSIAAAANVTNGDRPAASLDALDATRQVYVKSNDAARQCGCSTVVMPQVVLLAADGGELDAELFSQSFCPRCVCKYERRNTGIIKVVVVFVVVVIATLSLYMGFLLCLDPLIQRNRLLAYQAQTDDESVRGGGGGGISSGDEAAASSADESISMTLREAPGGGVLHRVGHQQSKWQRTVQEQRRNVYDRSAILN